jgi:hypothetical protein
MGIRKPPAFRRGISLYVNDVQQDMGPLRKEMMFSRTWVRCVKK